jgi:hypothetical protein
MANYSLTRYTTPEQDSIDDALAAIETKLETVDDTKTIRWIEIVYLSKDRQRCVGYCIYDT